MNKRDLRQYSDSLRESAMLLKLCTKAPAITSDQDIFNTINKVIKELEGVSSTLSIVSYNGLDD